MAKKIPIHGEPSLAQKVSRSLSTVRKKDMVEEVPDLHSGDVESLLEWARELMTQSGPKEATPAGLEKFFKTTNEVLSLIGTHGFKIPNPDVATAPFFSDAEPVSIREGLLHERLLHKQYVYSGDASQVRLAKFLLAKVKVDGKESNVLNELVQGASNPVAQALIAAGMPDAVCEQVQALKELQASSRLEMVPVHPLTKQIYFEEEGQEDILLIPVTSEAMVIEMQRQAVHPKNTARWLASRKLCAIGGANPVNGGALCSDIGGAFQLLEAAPPLAFDKSLLARLDRGGRIYTSYSISNADVLSFVKLASLEDKEGNVKERQEQSDLFAWFASVLVAPLLEADGLIAETLVEEVSGEKDSMGRYLRRDRSIDVNEDLAQEAASEVLALIVKTHEKLRDHVSDVRIREALIQNMKEALL